MPQVKTLPKRRSARFLLLPILAFIFMIGWIMYAVGGAKTTAKKTTVKHVTESDLEVGLTAEIAEEQTVTQ